MIDLHCHSTASDGTLSPAQLVRAAADLGLRAVALTDHDTVAGLAEFSAAGRHAALSCVPGVEVAAKTHRGVHIHILGLFVDPADTGLLEMLGTVRVKRRERNEDILRRLAELGYTVDRQALPCRPDDDVMGRPHIAKALVEAGYFRAPQDAFDKLLGRGRPAYVPRDLPEPAECIACLRNAGAVTVWAHPMVGNSMTNARMARIAARLRDAGLDGIEAYYPEHSAVNTAAVLDASRTLGLLVSGGSDFHGETMPTIALGTGRGTLNVPDVLLDDLRERAELRRSGRG